MSFGQGGPSRGPEDSRTPDWAALAEVSAARSQRRKWLFLGGGALATAAVATIVATAVVSAGRGSDSADKNAEPTALAPGAAEQKHRARTVLQREGSASAAQPQ